ncbi:SMC-Scp complex subunit ScpB [Algibacillus agarilyticus]|uniref:SMC-Scp complex subunit ScpB n=1 Tax=Algibacillus agarilyticus TaxID=2234133 RepID=UPI003F69DF3C
MKAKRKKHYSQIIEAAIFSAGKPLSVDDLRQTVLSEFNLTVNYVIELITDIQTSYHEHGIELAKVATGYRFQTRSELSPWLGKLWVEKAPKYSRAMLETLSLIAYKQPITRGEIEDIRGVAVSSNIMRSLQERGWIKVVGHKEIPGRPALFSTTSAFLDYFSLESLQDLPVLQEVAPTMFNLSNETAIENSQVVTQSDSGESDNV